MEQPEPSPPPKAISGALPRRRRWRRELGILVGLVLVYLLVAYIVLPGVWKRFATRHPSLMDIPNITHTSTGLPGDPINVSLVGTKAEVVKIMVAAKWHPADALTVHSCLEIAVASVFNRPDPNAPVSNLYLFDRKQDLAFEQPVDDNPRQRHHVRFWLTDRVDHDGRPIWVGAAIYDDRVGISDKTIQVTHHTAPDIDKERDKLFQDLQQTGDLAEVYFEDGFHKTLKGHNGGGDPWFTDGRLEVGVIAATGKSS
jgi:hypothetical protein